MGSVAERARPPVESLGGRRSAATLRGRGCSGIGRGGSALGGSRGLAGSRRNTRCGGRSERSRSLR